MGLPGYHDLPLTKSDDMTGWPPGQIERSDMRRELRGWTGARMPGCPIETKPISGFS